MNKSINKIVTIFKFQDNDICLSPNVEKSRIYKKL